MQLKSTGKHLAFLEQESLELLFLLAVSCRALLRKETCCKRKRDLLRGAALSSCGQLPRAPAKFIKNQHPVMFTLQSH
jgi:hypothetical protein